MIEAPFDTVAARELWNVGESADEIARLLGTNRSAVYAWAARKGWPSRKKSGGRPVVAEWQWLEARKWWDEGLTSGQIAIRLGCTASNVRKHAMEKKWPMRHARNGKLVRRASALPVRVRCARCWNTYEAFSEAVFSSSCPHCCSTTTRGAA